MRALTRLLFFSYALLVMKPVMPIIVDKLAHTFWENVHVAVVHVENGKQHVHYELGRAAKDLDKEKSGGKFKAGVEIAEHIVGEPILVAFTRPPGYEEQRFAAFASALLAADPEDDLRPPCA